MSYADQVSGFSPNDFLIGGGNPQEGQRQIEAALGMRNACRDLAAKADTEIADLRTALHELVLLKEYKDNNGKDGCYQQEMIIAWARARQVLNMPPAPTIHALKTWPEYFSKIEDGSKTFEIRKNDRNFRVSDRLRLLEWEPPMHVTYLGHAVGHYTGKTLIREITYITDYEQKPGYVVMGIKPVATNG